jgi:transcriptional regulator with XRE-family HTH domain
MIATVLKTEALKDRVDQRGVSLSQLARDVGISPQQMNNITHGRSLPSFEVYVKICEALGLPKPPLAG